ncbi:hypothetical protein NMG60_11034075 [Bertholletia excelsa]
MEALVEAISGSFLDRNSHGFVDLNFLSNEGDAGLHASPSPSSEGEGSDEGDSTDATLKLISQMLMEEDDLENKTCMLQECLALQATEKSFYDVLGEKYPPSLNQFNFDRGFPESPDGNSSGGSSNCSVSNFNFADFSNWLRDRDKLQPSFYAHRMFDAMIQSVNSPSGSSDSRDGSVDSLTSSFQVLDSSCKGAKVPQLLPPSDYASCCLVTTESNANVVADAEKNQRDNSPNGLREKKTHDREDGDFSDGSRSTKQLASTTNDSDEEQDMYDAVLLCPRLNPHLHPDLKCLHDDSASSHQKCQDRQLNRGRARGKRQGSKKEVVDLRTLLSQCAQAVASADIRSANDLLIRIRQHSSPHGDGMERMAHYFANALEARLAGTGTALYAASAYRRHSAADILKGYRVFVRACPFNKMSNMYANRSIGKLANKATKLHIIDFGILYGFQWPCLIQHLSVRSGGAPKLRITGIDFPQPGFRPAERVEETGRRLKTYCERFGVEFKYTAIAKKWETIELKDLNIDRDEVLVVNCVNRMRNVPDETVIEDSPRDKVLNLVRKINPNMFIHGVVNGTYNAPFFLTRFKEAVFHFSAGFDKFDANVPRDDQYRFLFEKEILGRDVMNVVACEGTERVERPETYKQWQLRTARAGFKQLALNREFVTDAKAKTAAHYNKDFVVDEDGKWMVLGWKGRIMHAISCWKPV